MKERILMYVDVGGGGAVHIIENPVADPCLTRKLVWGPDFGMTVADMKSAMSAASAVTGSFDYLLSGEISMKEATRRLRIIRAARKSKIDNPADQAAARSNQGKETT